MLCASCGSKESRVIDSRENDDGTAIRRRRVCESCGYRFTTYEQLKERPLVVVKSDKSLEHFDRDKLLRGLMTATKKRDVPMSRLNDLVDDVEQELRRMPRNEVRSKVLGDMVLERLREIDDVAYIRFISVYKDFKDIAEFQAALKGMK
ncbi:MAG: transcriptional regulator NrdR [Coriobacteriales bacterium]|jgi:transcriptional repressor NrdR|nr:transcriptional regulator NrdR [Coriobacteriales bacterium]